MTAPFVFNSLDQTLNYLLNETTSQTNEVKELLNLYNKAKGQYVPSSSKRNHIFVVFEGLDGCGKTTMTGLSSKKLKAVQVVTPPKCIQHLRSHFDNCESKLRRAYYSLGNYIAAMEIEALLNTNHIVMDRFWHSTAAYTLAESPGDLPAKGESVYEWPKDLLKPDISIYLTVREQDRLVRTAKRVATAEEEKLKQDKDFRSRLHQAYQGMESLTIIPSYGSPKYVFARIMETALTPLLEHCSF